MKPNETSVYRNDHLPNLHHGRDWLDAVHPLHVGLGETEIMELLCLAALPLAIIVCLAFATWDAKWKVDDESY